MFDCRLAVKPGFERQVTTFFEKIVGVVKSELEANISSLTLCKFMLSDLVLFNDGRVSIQIQFELIQHL